MEPPPRRAIRLGSTAYLFLEVAGLVGAYAALLGWRDGAFLLLAWALISFAWHLAVGVYAYRSTMGRPWPQVAPLSDDDWDD